MKKGVFSHGQSELHYSKIGTGARKVLAFHGFGQDHRAFSRHHSVLGEDCTLYSFDLFLFGQSKWDTAVPITMDRWKQFMSAFFHREGITDYEMLGFSLGARLCLATVCLFPRHARKLTLIAPDGIVVDPWYWFATANRLTRSLFRLVLRHPVVMAAPLRLMSSFGVIGREDFSYIARQLATGPSRERVYRVWNLYRAIRLRDAFKGRQLLDPSVPVLIFVGRKDKIIRRSRIEPVRRRIPHARVIELNCGHGSMITAAARWLAANGY